MNQNLVGSINGFRGENLKNQPFGNNNRLWRPCLLMDRNEMSNIYRGLPIDNTYQVSVLFSETALPKRTEIWWEAPIGYGSFCIKFPQSRMKGERHRLSSRSINKHGRHKQFLFLIGRLVSVHLA
jgi:hypothetical protein